MCVTQTEASQPEIIVFLSIPGVDENPAFDFDTLENAGEFIIDVWQEGNHTGVALMVNGQDVEFNFDEGFLAVVHKPQIQESMAC